MKKMIEARRLKQVHILYDGANRWTLQWKGNFFVFNGSVEEFGKFLRKIHAKDTKQNPKSYRSMKYSDMASEIKSGEYASIWVWEKDLKKLKKD